MIKKITKAVIPVAGLGTRNLPATKVMPKEMLTVVDKPLIQHVVEEAKQAGITDFIFVISSGKEVIRDHFLDHPALNETLAARDKGALLDLVKAANIDETNIHLAYQEKPLGLGHAVWCAREIVRQDPFAVMLPDELILSEVSCLKQLIDVYEEKGGNVMTMMEVPRSETYRYGILDAGGETGSVVPIINMVEKPKVEDAPSNFCIHGRYIFQPEIFDYLGQHKTGAGGEIQLTDAMVDLLNDQKFHGCLFEGQRLDCGNKLGFVLANLAYGLKDGEIGDDVREAVKKAIS